MSRFIFSSNFERGLFNQIAMFSAAGLSSSLALVFVTGIRFLNPWF